MEKIQKHVPAKRVKNAYRAYVKVTPSSDTLSLKAWAKKLTTEGSNLDEDIGKWLKGKKEAYLCKQRKRGPYVKKKQLQQQGKKK